MRVCDSRLHVPLLSFEATTTSPGPPPPPRPTEPTATVREGCRLPRPRRHKLRLGGFENLRDRATRLGRGARCSRPARGPQGSITAAPLLLVFAYVVLIPMAIIK